jgi:opacity protein-like surface antigen
MKRFFACLAILAGLLSTPTLADVYVQGYVRQDGTYVQPHWRSSPDNNYNNNWSVRPNVNPYTGQPGTRTPSTYDSYRVQPLQRTSPCNSTFSTTCGYR